MRLRPDDPPAPTLALVAAVALHDALSRFAPGLSIKWPNDLLVGLAKLAGILLERAGDAVVIGFGANLWHHPDNLDRAVTSIAAETGAAPSPGEAVETLADTFAAWLARWRSDGLPPVRAAWLAAAHPIGTPLATSQGNGTFAGLEPSGALRLRTSGDNIILVHAGDVFLLA